MTDAAVAAVPAPSARSPLRALVVTTFFFYFGFGMTTPVLPLFGRSLGAGEALAGVLVAAFSVASFCFDIVGGRVSDRVGARRAAVGGALLVTAASLIAAFAPTYGVLLASRLLTGIGSAFYVTTAMNILARTSEPAQMGRAMSLYQGAILTGVSLGPTAGGLLTQLGSFRPPFLLYGLCALICAVVAWRMLPARLPKPAARPGVDARLGAVLRDSAFMVALLIAFTVFTLRSGFSATTVPLYANESLGLSRGMVGLALSAASLTNLLCLYHAGLLADRRPRGISTALGAAAGLVGMLLLVGDTGVPGLFVAMGFVGVATAYAGVTPAPIITDVTPPALSGTALGFYRMAVDAASAMSPIVAGLIIAAAGYHQAFAVACLPLALVIIVALRLRDTRRATVAGPLGET
jgi:MFS family permease